LVDARPHTAAATVNHIATFGWKLLDHAPYSLDLAHSDFHFFPTLKRTLEGRNGEAAVRTQDTDFYQQGFFKLVKRRDKCFNVDGDYIETLPTSACILSMQFPADDGLGEHIFRLALVFPTILRINNF
jgi:hypothetical protein